MRTLKFRGKRKTNDEWIKGGFIMEYRSGETYIGTEDGVAKVSRDTIGQFTGMVDKNGNEIYEGDVLIGSYVDSVDGERYEYTQIIEWGQDIEGDGDGWAVREGNAVSTLGSRLAADFEVIGNVYDNPELGKVDP